MVTIDTQFRARIDRSFRWFETVEVGGSVWEAKKH